MNDGFMPGVILASIIWLLAITWAISNLNDSWRHQIANHGCAEFYLDQNKDKQWKWTK